MAGTSYPPDVSHEEEEKKFRINDAQFMHDLKRIRQLQSFLVQEAVGTAGDQKTTQLFGELNLLRWDAIGGRPPTLEEWNLVETHTREMFANLTEPLRKKFLLGQVPWWVSWLPYGILLVALGSMTLAIEAAQVGLEKANIAGVILPCYLVWQVSLGAIGSVAFIAMNVLSVQQDVTFDLSNRRLMMLRIALGSLFGVVLSLPFGFDGYAKFVAAISHPSLDTSKNLSGSVALVSTQALLLLLPFIFGFSTTVVILVLNRLISGVQALFGGNQDQQGRQQGLNTGKAESLSIRSDAHGTKAGAVLHPKTQTAKPEEPVFAGETPHIADGDGVLSASPMEIVASHSSK